MKVTAISTTITAAHISVTLVVFIVCGVAAYTYFVASSVLHVVVRQTAEEQLVAVRSDIAAMETELMAAQHAISHRLAAAPREATAPEKIFLTRAPADVAMVENNAN